MYRFRYLDVNHPELELSDGTEKIILNASAKWDDTNPELSAFLQYVRTGIPDNSLSENISNAITDVLNHKEWEVEYQMYTDKLQDAYLKGEENGEANGVKKTEDAFSRLSAAMQEHGYPSDDIIRTMSDADFRKEMMQKFGIG